MIIRHSQLEDIDAIQSLYENARKFMAENGNPNQWAHGYPPKNVIEKDISQGNSYICLHENNIVGTFYYAIENDPTYATITEGTWLNNNKYGVIHRITSNGLVKGIGSFCINWCLEQAGNIRIDTHRDNTIMDKLLIKSGFTKCGIIYLENGDERIAYQKYLESTPDPIQVNHYLIFYMDQLLMKKNAPTLQLPESQHFEDNFIQKHHGFLNYQVDNQNFYVFDVDSTSIQLEDYTYGSLRDYRDYHLDLNYSIAVSGLQLLNWSRKHQYCGVCGSKLEPLKADRSKQCPSCSNILFPQMSIAVITAIFKDDQILLAHNANFQEGYYSLIAGFVDIGETLESAVQREIFEEVGLKVKNIRYFGSQPWPFPNSLMVGFIADYESGEIQVDNIEILDAHWFSSDKFPNIPHQYSIARKIIDSYVNS